MSLTGIEGVRIQRFREPLPAEQFDARLDAVQRLAPALGELVFFNRSYYGTAFRACRDGRPGVTKLCAMIVRFEQRWAKPASHS